MDSVESLVHLSLREEERKTKKETHLQVDHIERTNEFIKLPDSKTCQPHVNVQSFFFLPRHTHSGKSNEITDIFDSCKRLC